MNAQTAKALELDGKSVVVTGTGSGIGRAIALAMAREGARVAMLERDADGLAETAHIIRDAGGEALPLACDVSDPAAVREAARKAEDWFGVADVLVNNAGMILPGPLADLSFDDWNKLLSVNLTGYFLCAQTFGAGMLARGRGRLVHVASIAAHHATPNAGAYSVAKAGVKMLSEQLAIEWGPSGVRSNAVSPGLIYTALSADMYSRPGVREAREKTIPDRRIGEPEDVADAVLYLASDRAQYVNGAEIMVDGGFTRNILSMIPRAGYD